MWLLEQSAVERLQRAYESGALAAMCQKGDVFAIAPGASRLLKVAGGTAAIHITGILTNERDLMAEWFGGGNAVYGDIIEAVNAAESDPEVKEILFDVDNSPGGSIAGLFPAMESIAAAKKPTVARVRNMAASATYALISQTDKIVATNPGARFGSVGVVVDAFVDKRIVSVTSTEAPDKRPDPQTPEGQAIIRGELDPIHSLMAKNIGKGRGISEKEVNANFGRGSVMLAAQAVKANMIDGVGTSKNKTTATAGNEPASGNNEEAKEMDLNELRTKHPDVYAAAVKFGADQEQSRVRAHLIGAEQSGDNAVAFAAIRDGSEVTSELMMTYAMAGIKRAEIQNREGDNPDPDAGTGDAPEPKPEDETAKAVEAKLVEEFGEDSPAVQAFRAGGVVNV